MHIYKNNFKLFSAVALLKEIPESNLLIGQVGAVVEVHTTDVFEIEFVTNEGKTISIETIEAKYLLPLHFESGAETIAA